MKAIPTERIRGREGMKRRIQYLNNNPLCIQCKDRGRITAAREVDHIIPLWRGGADTDENKAALCIECHKLKTANDQPHRRVETGIDGWPVE